MPDDAYEWHNKIMFSVRRLFLPVRGCRHVVIEPLSATTIATTSISIFSKFVLPDLARKVRSWKEDDQVRSHLLRTLVSATHLDFLLAESRGHAFAEDSATRCLSFQQQVSNHSSPRSGFQETR